MDDEREQGADSPVTEERGAPDAVPALRAELEALRSYRQTADTAHAALVTRLGEQQGALEAAQARADALARERDAARQAALAAQRRALLAEHRGAVVAELIQGDTAEALEASVTRARAAHEAIAEELRQQATHAVPAGNPPRGGPALESLSPQAKIAAALRGR